ncbi:single-stranded DNA-binding protein [Peptoniphilus sp. KCTC 25270]|uniref:single-stranded DNA-binding protein n=1 Tax=Peptoniphilus sp. KCTC 25270 TaxID=2897414 RepID=UPI001E4D3F46|nr:single-stranded DNA-binding protein [Peptoniphilus sp. KCTC 25270]MCD1147762.1 single-stranded DNA-binding protein [Peptoniphilus sp. KCTC 25270]
MNVVILNGNLCADWEARYTKGGKMIADTSMAIRETQEKTTFIRLKAWEKTANLALNHTRKGDRITVEGRLQVESYQKDGKTNYYTYVVVDRIYFGFKPRADEATQEAREIFEER